MISSLINQGIYILFTIGMSYYHSRLIKNGKPIKHGYWALAAIGAAALFAFISIWYVPVMIIWRMILFSPFLAKFRGLPWSYSSPTSTSIIDKIERKIFPSFSVKIQWYFGLLFIAEILLYTL